ncbi:hypothetical protein NDU88_001674 [Pleurodeles waltl]|uniref:Secreted protein n=1 Tax=Pleurodeles waltl TaxID=8319 RepID=A0AAV7S9F5_PLEWA|nr:hypothetical protein NDU88_001674 [Pleurodeles waltl]
MKLLVLCALLSLALAHGGRGRGPEVGRGGERERQPPVVGPPPTAHPRPAPDFTHHHPENATGRLEHDSAEHGSLPPRNHSLGSAEDHSGENNHGRRHPGGRH